jgi:hypothetical protein
MDEACETPQPSRNRPDEPSWIEAAVIAML